MSEKTFTVEEVLNILQGGTARQEFFHIHDTVRPVRKRHRNQDLAARRNFGVGRFCAINGSLSSFLFGSEIAYDICTQEQVDKLVEVQRILEQVRKELVKRHFKPYKREEPDGQEAL